MIPRSHSLAAATAALLFALVAGLGTWEAAGWIGKPFPGFLLLGNGVIASAGGHDWPAHEHAPLFQHRVVAVDGQPLAAASDLERIVRARPAGTPFHYTLRFEDRTFERTIPSRLFELDDFAMLFGVYLLNGGVLAGCAVAILLAGRMHASARAVLPFLLVSAGWGLSAIDLYGPYRWFRFHALCESLLWATALQLALCYPAPVAALRRVPALVLAPYAVAAVLAVVYQAVLMDPTAYVTVHLLATSALGASLLALTLCLVGRYFWRAPAAVRAQLQVLAVGAVLALSPIVALTLTEPLTGGSAPQNAVGFTSFLFFLSLGYAALGGPQPRTDAARR